MVDKQLPPGLTEQAQRSREAFEASYFRAMERLRSISLNVLVWGPNADADGPVARKRKDIRDALISYGHNAMFSEDLTRLAPQGIYSLQAQEFFQAHACDVIVVLIEQSPGAMAEVHDFASDPLLARKFVILAPKKYDAGYSALGVLRDLQDAYGAVYWYTAEQLDACDVLASALRKVEARRFLRLKRLGVAE